MAAPYSNLASKLDRAIVAYLISESAGTALNTFPSKRSSGKELPITVAFTDSLVVFDNDISSGTRQASCSVSVKSNVIDDDGTEALRLASETQVANVFDALNKQGQATDLLCDAINAAAWALAASDPTNHADLTDFSIIGFQATGESQGFDESGVWVDSFNFKAIVCASQKA